MRYPKFSVSFEYASNEYFGQYTDLKLLYRDYVGVELLYHFISYTDMKSEYPIQVIDFTFQVDHINLQKSQVFEEYRSATNKARLFMILIRDINKEKSK